jgi:hypothetical protein
LRFRVKIGEIHRPRQGAVFDERRTRAARSSRRL